MKGLLYASWGNNPIFHRELELCVNYGKKLNLDTALITTPNDNTPKICKYNLEIECQYGHKKGFAIKSSMFHVSPFQHTLYVDTDAFIMSQDLEYGFEQAKNHGIAMCIDPSSPRLFDFKVCKPKIQQKTLSQLLPKYNSIDENIPMYNGGVIFFYKSKITEKIFNEWQFVCQNTNFFPQTLLSFVFAANNFQPAILSCEWNYRPHYPNVHSDQEIKIWHSRETYPNKELEDFYKKTFNVTRYYQHKIKFHL